MTVRREEMDVYECDGCGSETIMRSDDPPLGHTVHWADIDGSGGYGDKLWACKQSCMIKAYKRRVDIMHEREEASRGG